MSGNYEQGCVLGLRFLSWAHLLLVTDPLILKRTPYIRITNMTLQIITSVTLTLSHMSFLISMYLCSSSLHAHHYLANSRGRIAHLSSVCHATFVHLMIEWYVYKVMFIIYKVLLFLYYPFTLNRKHHSISISIINIHTFIIVDTSRQSYANSCAKLSFKCQAWCVVCCHCGRGLTGAQTSLSPHRLLTFERYENDFACTILGVQLSPWTNLLCVFLLIKT